MKKQGASPEFVKLARQISESVNRRLTGYPYRPIPCIPTRKNLFHRLMDVLRK